MNEETIIWWYSAFKLVVFLLIPICFTAAIVGKIMQMRKKDDTPLPPLPAAPPDQPRE